MADELAERAALLQRVGSQRESGASANIDDELAQRAARLHDQEKGLTVTGATTQKAAADTTAPATSSIPPLIAAPTTTGSPTSTPAQSTQQQAAVAQPLPSGPTKGQQVEKLLISGPFKELFKRLAPEGITSEILQGIGMTLDLPVQGIAGGVKMVQETLAKSGEMYDKGDVISGLLYNAAAPVHGAFAGMMNVTGGGLLFQAGQKVIETAIPDAKPLIEKGLAPFSTTIAEREAGGEKVAEWEKAGASLLDAAWGIYAFKKAHEVTSMGREALVGPKVDVEAKYSTPTENIMTPKELQTRKAMDAIQEARDLAQTLRDETTPKPRQEATTAPTGTEAPRRVGAVPLTGEERGKVMGDELTGLKAAREALAKTSENPQVVSAIDRNIELLQKDPEGYARAVVESIQHAIDSPTTAEEMKPALKERLTQWNRFEIKEQAAAQPVAEAKPPAVPVAAVSETAAPAPARAPLAGEIPKEELDALMKETVGPKSAKTPRVKKAAPVEETPQEPKPPSATATRESQESPPAAPTISEVPKLTMMQRLSADTPIVRRFVADKLGLPEQDLEGQNLKQLLDRTGKGLTNFANEVGADMELPEVLATWSERGVAKQGNPLEGQFVREVAEGYLARPDIANVLKSAGRDDLVAGERMALSDQQVDEALTVMRSHERGATSTPTSMAPTAPAGAPIRGRKLRAQERLEVATASRAGEGAPWNPYIRKGETKPSVYKSDALAQKAATALMRNKPDTEAQVVQSGDAFAVETRSRTTGVEIKPAIDHLNEIVNNNPDAKGIVGDLDNLFGLGEQKPLSKPKSGEFNYSPPQGGYDPRIFPHVRDQLQKLWSQFEKSGKTFEQFHDAVMEGYDGKGIDIMRYMRESFPDKEMPEIEAKTKAVIEQRTAAAKKGMKDAGVDDATAAAVESGQKPDGTPIGAEEIDRAGQRIAKEQAPANDAVKRNDLLQKARSSPERARLKQQLVDQKWGTGDDIESGLALWDYRAMRWAQMTGESPELWWKSRGVEARGAGQERVAQQTAAFRENKTALEFRKNGDIVLNALKAPNFNSFLGSSFQLFFGDMAMTLRDLNVRIVSMENGSAPRVRLEAVKNQLIADIGQLEKATGLKQGEFNDLFRRVQADLPSQTDNVRFRDAMQKMADIGDRYFTMDEARAYIEKDMQPMLKRFHEWMVGFWSSAKAKMRGADLSPATMEALKRWFWDKPAQRIAPSLGQKASPRDYVGIGADLAQWMQNQIAPLVTELRKGLGRPALDNPQVLMTTLAEVFRSNRDPNGIRFGSLREAKEYVGSVRQRQSVAARLKNMGILVEDEYAGMDPVERETARAMDDKISNYMDGIRRRFYGISDNTRSVPLRGEVENLLRKAQTTSPEKLLGQTVSAIQSELQTTLNKIAELEKPLKEAKAEQEAEYTKAAAQPNLTVTSPELAAAQLKKRGMIENLVGLKARAKDLDDLYRFLAGRVEYGKERVALGTEAEPLPEDVVKALHQSPKSEGHIAFIGDKEFFYKEGNIYKADITGEIGSDARRTGTVHEKWSKEAAEGVKWMARQNPRSMEGPETMKQRTVTVEQPADPVSYKETFINEIKMDLAALDIFGNKADEMGWRESKRILESVRSGNPVDFQPWQSDSGIDITLPVLEQSIDLVQHMNKSDNQLHRALIRDFFPDLHAREVTDPVQRPLPDISVTEAATGKRYKTEKIFIPSEKVDQAKAIAFRVKLKVGQTAFVVDPQSGNGIEAKIEKIRIGEGGHKFVTVDFGATGGGVREISAANVFEKSAEQAVETRVVRREMTPEEIYAEDRATSATGTVVAGARDKYWIRPATPRTPAIVEPSSMVEIPIEHVVNQLQRAFKVPINTKSKLFAWGKDIFGKFREGPQSIWTREYGDLDAIGHELGHFIEQKYLNNMLTQGNQLSALMQQELARLDYDPAQARVGEGFAEYFSNLMTNRDAQTLAPNFHHFFMNTILPNHPELLKAIGDGRQKIWDYQSMSAIAKVGSLMDDIGGGKLSDASWKDRVGAITTNAKAGFRFRWTNSLDPIRMWVAEITSMGSPQGVTLSPSKDPYQLAMYVSKSAPAMTRYMVEHGVYNAQGELMCEGLKEIIGKLPDDDAVKNGLKLSYALRAEELMNRRDPQGSPTPVDVGLNFQEIQAVKNAFSDPMYREFADGLHRWNHAVLEYLIDAGGLDRAEGEIIRNANLMYIPLKVAFEGHWDVHMGKWTGLGESYKFREGGGGRSFIDSAKPYSRIEGSKMGKVNPLEAMVMQTERIVSLANRARVSRAMVELAENVEGIAPWIEKVQPIKASSIRIAQMSRELEASGISLPQASLDKIVTIFSNADHYYGAENVVSLIKDGKRQFYKIDPYLYKALTSMTTRQWSPILNWLTIPARFVRVGTTGYNAAFNLLTNPMRDMQTAALQYSPNPDARNIGTAMAQVWGDTFKTGLGKIGIDIPRNPEVERARELWHAGGGEMSQPLGQERFGESSIKRLVDDAVLEGKIGAKAVTIALHPADAMGRLLDAYKRVISIPESVPREAEFLRIMDEHRPQIARAEQMGNVDLAARLKEDMMVKAGNAASDITVNFRRAGIYAEILNRVIPFFNPSIQGTTKAYRMFKETPVSAMMRASALVGASMAVWAMNKDKEWYNELPAWERYGFWHFEAPNGEIVRVPMPFEWGYIFAGIPQAVMHDAYVGGNEEKKNIAGQIAKQLLPVDVAPITTDVLTGKTDIGSAVVNQGVSVLGDVAAIRPIVELAMNKDLFRDRPIVPKELEDVQKWLQYTSTTPELARKIGSMGFWGTSGISPIAIEHLASGYTGGLAREFMKAPTALRIIKSTMPSEPSDMIVLGRLFVRHNIHGFGSKDVQQFYNTFDKATEYKKTIDNLNPPRGDRPLKMEEIVMAVEEGHLPSEAVWMYKAYPAFMETRGFLQAARKEENALRNQPDKNDDEKRQISEALAKAVMMKVKIANAGFKAYMESH